MRRPLLLLTLLAACAAPAPPEVPPDLETARAAWQADPGSEWNIVWYGRRTAYTGDYLGAVAIYRDGLERHPDSVALLRHRGHRWLSLREFGNAVDDLERAAALMAGTADEVEADGMPNDRGVPTSTLHGNVWYHLGLARYCRGEFAQAQRAWAACLETARNPDMECAARYWLHHAALRAGDTAAAAAALDGVRADWDVIENHAYHRLLLMYRGELSPEELLAEAGEAGSLDFSSVGYGVGAWYLNEGREDEAEALFRRIVEAGNWPSFGHMAAEAELAARDR